MKRYVKILLAGLLLTLICNPPASAAQTCKQTITASTPDSQFNVRVNGTVVHKPTGLMWMLCSLGQTWDGKTCSETATTYTWGAALQAASRHTFSGYNDWRLPNKNELESILEERCFSPAINANIFPATPPAYFWTSSPFVGLADGAWSIDFGYGLVNASVKSGALNVRLVRGGR
jgi:hypothetical protein